MYQKLFIEDPLRAYRAARFAAKFNFNISPDTLILMHSLKPELHTLSKERVFLEMKKALLTHTPSVFFKTLRQADILDVHFEEIYNLINVPQPIKYHPEGDVFNHTMIVLDKVSKESKNVETRFCALTHDLGKGVTPKDILPRHINHEVYGLNEIKNFCNRLKTPNIWKKKALATCKYHMKAGICQNMRPYKLAKFINDVNKSAISLEDLNIISNADDMLNREKLQFSTLGREMFKNVNGNTLKESGITIDSVGIEKYNHILLEKQAQFLSNQF